MGTEQDLYLDFHYPTAVSDPKEHIENKVKAGAVYVITWDTGRMSMQSLNRKMVALKQTKADLENQAYDKIQPEALLGDILHTIGVAYFFELDVLSRMLEQNSGVRAIRMTSEAITASDLKVDLLFGLPRTVSQGGLVMDIDRDLYSVRSIDGDMEKVKAFNMSNGMMGSYLEGGIFEQIFGGQAVSTIHILQYANQQGIKIYQINQSNVDAVVPLLQYDSAKKQMLRDLIAAGHEITIPERDVTISGWTGTGYIILDPADGTGTYMIDGGLAGAVYMVTAIISVFWGVVLLIVGGLSGGGLFVGSMGILMFMFAPIFGQLPPLYQDIILAIITIYVAMLAFPLVTGVSTAIAIGAAWFGLILMTVGFVKQFFF